MKLGSGVRRAAGGVVAAAACAVGTAALTGGGALPRVALAPVGVAAATPAPTCLIPGIPLPLGCTSPPSPTATPSPTSHPGPSGQPGPSSTPGSGPPPTLSIVGNPRPVTLPLPTVAPSPTPKFAPGSPDLAVQAILLSSLAGDAVTTGSTFPLQATCTATRGADTYAVPGATVTFTVSGPGSLGTSITPVSAACDSTGQTTVSVTVGSSAGDLGITARSGGATGTHTVHVTASASPTPSAASTATSTPAPVAPGGPTVTTSGTVPPERAPEIAGLFAFGVAVLVTTLLRGPLRRLARAPVGAVPGGRR